jgi:hypothetical protein
MGYPEADFDFDVPHFTVSHKPTGAIFRFDDYPDPINGNEVEVTILDDFDDDELTEMCNAAGLHLKARIDRMRS